MAACKINLADLITPYRGVSTRPAEQILVRPVRRLKMRVQHDDPLASLLDLELLNTLCR